MKAMVAADTAQVRRLSKVRFTTLTFVAKFNLVWAKTASPATLRIVPTAELEMVIIWSILIVVDIAKLLFKSVFGIAVVVLTPDVKISIFNWRG